MLLICSPTASALAPDESSAPPQRNRVSYKRVIDKGKETGRSEACTLRYAAGVGVQLAVAHKGSLPTVG